MKSRLEAVHRSLFAILLFTGMAIGAAQIAPPGQTVPPTPPQPGKLAPKSEQQPAEASPSGSSANVEAPAPDSGPNAKPDISVTTRQVLVPTTVKDLDTGGYINGLAAADFTVYDNDKPQTITSEATFQPLSLVLVVQANSEIEPVLPKIKKMGVLLQGLVTGEGGQVAVVAFDHRQQVLQDFTTDAAKLDDAMQKVRAGSSTAALIDSVWYADHMLVDHDPGNKTRRVVLLLSRDVDKGSEAHLEETARKMQFDNVLVYCVNMSKFLTTLEKKMDYPRPQNGGIPPEALPNLRGAGIPSDTTVIQQQDGNVLAAIPPIYRSVRDVFKKTPAEAFTAFTGGRIYSFATQRSLEDAITDIGKDLQSQYLLSYSPNDTQEPGFHTIRVEVNKPRLEIRTRPGYWWGGGKL